MVLSITNGAKVFMALGSRKGTQKTKKSAAPKPQADRPLWIPNAEVPEWLDGSLPGDRGFDPLGLSKPVEYLQFDIDQQDQNKAIAKPGDIIGQFKPNDDEVSTQSLQPYSEVFSLQRFRECELIHGRWAMLATLGCIVGELSTGVNWIDAGFYELGTTEYLGLNLPFTISQVVAIEVLVMGYIEVQRNSELDTEKRIYPGGNFDPFNLSTPDRAFRLRTAEIKHARLAMVSMFGFGVQALTTGSGPVENLAQIGRSLGKQI